MNSSHHIRKSKIEVTQLIQEKYKDHQDVVTPPKFRTNQTVRTEVTSRQSSRYQTLQHRTNPTHFHLPTQISRDSSAKKKQKTLYIDTDLINKQYQLEANPKKDVTPLFASQDSVTILHRLQNQRKNAKVSYDNLIDAIKLNYNKQQQQLKVINLSDDHFQVSHSKVYDSHLNSRMNHQIENPQKSLIKSIYGRLDEIRGEIGYNAKLVQIGALLQQLEQQLEGKKQGKSQSQWKASKLQANQIQNSLILKDYTNNYNWFSKDRKENIPRKVGYQNQRAKTMMEENKQREKPKSSFKSKSPLRQILNYVNKKK